MLKNMYVYAYVLLGKVQVFKTIYKRIQAKSATTSCFWVKISSTTILSRVHCVGCSPCQWLYQNKQYVEKSYFRCVCPVPPKPFLHYPFRNSAQPREDTFKGTQAWDSIEFFCPKLKIERYIKNHHNRHGYIYASVKKESSLFFRFCTSWLQLGIKQNL